MHAHTVIDRIGNGGVRETARRLKLPVKTVHNWKQRGDSVPKKKRPYVLAAARLMGVSLDEKAE